MKKRFIFICMSVCLCTTCMFGAVQPKEGIGYSGIGITDRCELPCGSCEVNLCSLQQHKVLLTTELSLAPKIFFLLGFSLLLYSLTKLCLLLDYLSYCYIQLVQMGDQRFQDTPNFIICLNCLIFIITCTCVQACLFVEGGHRSTSDSSFNTFLIFIIFFETESNYVSVGMDWKLVYRSGWS